MKRKKLMIALAAMVLTTSVAIACSKDDDNKDNGGTGNADYPKTLTYQGYNVVESKMYVGSSEGGKETDTKNMNIETHWKDEVQKFGAKYLLQKYIFSNDSVMTYIYSTETQYTGPYRYNNGEVEFFNEDEGWRVLGTGDKSRVHKIYILSKAVKNGNLLDSYGFDNLKDGLTESGFETLDNMKNVTDTIMWCKVECFWK